MIPRARTRESWPNRTFPHPDVGFRWFTHLVLVYSLQFPVEFLSSFCQWLLQNPLLTIVNSLPERIPSCVNFTFWHFPLVREYVSLPFSETTVHLCSRSAREPVLTPKWFPPSEASWYCPCSSFLLPKLPHFSCLNEQRFPLSKGKQPLASPCPVSASPPACIPSPVPSAPLPLPQPSGTVGIQQYLSVKSTILINLPIC